MLSSMPDFSGIIKDSINSNLNAEWNIAKPYVISAVSVTIVIAIIKMFGRKIVRWFSQMSGDNKRQTRQKVRQFNNRIDLISSIKDLLGLIHKS